jgi:hypothetical protein
MLRWLIRRTVAAPPPDRFAPYLRAVAALSRPAVPLAHALVHSVAGIDDELRRWLDLQLAAAAPTALGRPASRALVSVWHALQDSRVSGLPVSADAEWALLCAVGQRHAALEVFRFLLTVYAVTAAQGAATDSAAVAALAGPATPWDNGFAAGVTATTTRS